MKELGELVIGCNYCTEVDINRKCRQLPGNIVMEIVEEWPYVVFTPFSNIRNCSTRLDFIREKELKVQEEAQSLNEKSGGEGGDVFSLRSKNEQSCVEASTLRSLNPLSSEFQLRQ